MVAGVTVIVLALTHKILGPALAVPASRHETPGCRSFGCVPHHNGGGRVLQKLDIALVTYFT